MLRHHLLCFWILIGLCHGAVAAPPIALNASQQQWLKDHPRIVWAPEADYQPFIFVDQQGLPTGLSNDLLALLDNRLNLGLEAAPPAQLSQLLEQVKRGEVDLLTSLRPTEERAELLGFTTAYVQVPTVLVVPTGTDTDLSLDQLSGKKVAVGKGYAVEAYARKGFPNIDWQAMPSDSDSLKALSAGDVAAAVMDLGSASYLLGQHGAEGLRVGNRISFDYPLSLAYRKDWPELGEILEAGLRSITPKERGAMLKQWLGPLPDDPALPGSQRLTVIAISLIGVAILLLLAYQRRRKSQGQAPV